MLSIVQEQEGIEKALTKLIKDGQIEEQFKNELIKYLEDIMSNQEYISLFKNQETILSEAAIIISDNETIRPDKVIVKKEQTVVIDYKTGLPNKKHTSQIKLYTSTLENIGFPKVECFLYYTALKKLEKIS